MSVKSKSTAVHGAKKPLFPSATVESVCAHLAAKTADAAQPLQTATPGQRIEQMYQLADIFASIFEALPNEYKHAIATEREAA